MQMHLPSEIFPVTLNILNYNLEIICHNEISILQKTAKTPWGMIILPLMKPINENTHYIKCKITCHNISWALSKAIKLIDYFRGTIHLTTGFGNQQFLMGNSEPRALIKHCPWAVIVTDENTWETVEFGDDSVGDAVYDAKMEVYDRFIRLVNLINIDQKREFIGDLLRLYGRSFELKDRERTFIALWNLLERITLSDRMGGETRAISNRVLTIFNTFTNSDLTILVKYSMGMFSSFRNDIVHRGAVNILDDESLITFKIIGNCSGGYAVTI